MYDIIFYKDKMGKSAIIDFLDDLKEKSVTDKNARIKFVMVHHFVKKANKTPKKELERTRNNMKDYIERNGA